VVKDLALYISCSLYLSVSCLSYLCTDGEGTLCIQQLRLLSLLCAGMRNRSVGRHNMNDYSSRSHTILTVRITSEQQVRVATYPCLVPSLRMMRATPPAASMLLWHEQGYIYTSNSDFIQSGLHWWQWIVNWKGCRRKRSTVIQGIAPVFGWRDWGKRKPQARQCPSRNSNGHLASTS
jgi:hypothetical protein